MLYKTALYSVTQEYTAVKIGIDTVVASNEIEHVPANTQSLKRGCISVTTFPTEVQVNVSFIQAY